MPALRLDDGSVLRIGGTSKSAGDHRQRAGVDRGRLAVLLITVLAASLLTGTIIRPINKIDLNAAGRARLR
ncbi:MAG: hypothetical protein ACLUFV_13290 [Acutalibacteraceae bacterium]